MLLSVLLLVIRIWFAIAFFVVWVDKKNERYSWVLLPLAVFMLSSGTKGFFHAFKMEEFSTLSGWVAVVSGMLVAIEMPSIMCYYMSFANVSAMSAANRNLAKTVYEMSERQDIYLSEKKAEEH